jgi:hypothetical protein
MADYPAVGSALAWERPVELAAGDSLVRTLTVWIVDAKLSPAEVAELAASRDSAAG